MDTSGDDDRSVAQGTRSAVSLVASDGTVLVAGLGVVSYVGDDIGNRQSRKVFASVVPEDRDAALAMFASVVDGARPYAAMTVRIRRADGAVRLADLQLVDHRDGGIIPGILVVSRDVTVEHAQSVELSQLRAAERFLGESARTIARVPFAELDAAMERLVGEAGQLLGVRRISLSGSDNDHFDLAYNWRAEGEPESNNSIDIDGFTKDLSRWMQSSLPRWIDIARLARRSPAVAERASRLGDRLLLYGVRLSDEGWGVLSIWDAKHDSAAEFMITGLADLWSVVAARKANFAHRERAEARLETLLSRSSDLLIVHDKNLVLSYVSPGSMTLLGIEPKQAVGRSALEFLHPDDVALLSRGLLGNNRSLVPTIVRVRSADGTYRTFEAFVSDLRDDVNVRGIVVNARDVTDLARYKAEMQRYRALERLVREISKTFATSAVHLTDELLIASLHEVVAFTGATLAGILVSDSDRCRSIHQSGAGFELFERLVERCDLGELRRLSPMLFAGDVVTQRADEPDHLLIDAVESANRHKPISGLLAIPLRAGEEVMGVMLLLSIDPNWDCSRDYIGPLHTVGEIAAGALSRQQVERRLAEGALRDSLTGLPNRRMLLEILHSSLDANPQTEMPIALMFVDCDGFKAVNDGCGHECGDLLLVAIARRLEQICSGHGSIARLGGDEFVVLVNRHADNASVHASVHALADRIVEHLREPYDLDGRPVGITVSVGIAIHSVGDVATDAATLLRRADLAMYQAKQTGRDRVCTFADDIDRPKIGGSR